MEVRVRDERALFALVQRAVRAAISAAAESTLAVGAAPGAAPSEGGAGYTFRGGATATAAPAQAGPAGGKVVSLRERIRDAYGDAVERGEPSFPNPQLSLRAAEPTAGTREAIETIRSRGLGDEALFWQLHHSYIFIQVRGGVVVTDQHAAHERVIFDTTRRQLEGSAPPSQQILFSIPMELSLAELEVFRAGRDVFRGMGFDLEPFGGKSILVRGYPAGLRNWEDGRLLLQIFDDLVRERVPGDTLTDKLVASFACRSAIKAGQKLSVEEMRLLADQLFEVENPYSCPHGRPTIHRLSLEEIERWFHRR
jgi:DNA mismatch repair protein MutL